MKQSIQQANQFGTQWVEIIPKGGLFFRKCDLFFKSQKKNIPKNYPELEIKIFRQCIL